MRRELRVNLVFLRRPPAIEKALLAADLDHDALGHRHHALQRHPPQFAEPVGKARRHEQRERRLVPLENRQRVFEVVAVAVVEGERNEMAGIVPLDEPAAHLVLVDDIDAAPAQPHDHAFEKARLDFEQSVRLESTLRARANVVERENRPHAAIERPQGMVGAGKIQRLQPRPEYGIAQVRHRPLKTSRLLPTCVFDRRSRVNPKSVGDRTPPPSTGRLCQGNLVFPLPTLRNYPVNAINRRQTRAGTGRGRRPAGRRRRHR